MKMLLIIMKRQQNITVKRTKIIKKEMRKKHRAMLILQGAMRFKQMKNLMKPPKNILRQKTEKSSAGKLIITDTQTKKGMPNQAFLF